MAKIKNPTKSHIEVSGNTLQNARHITKVIGMPVQIVEVMGEVDSFYPRSVTITGYGHTLQGDTRDTPTGHLGRLVGAIETEIKTEPDSIKRAQLAKIADRLCAVREQIRAYVQQESKRCGF